MTDSDWDMIVRVHLNGAYSVTKAAWPYLQDQEFGRVITVSSPAGLYGNVGQANYSMAKSGLNGFMQTLAKEGGRRNIHANARWVMRNLAIWVAVVVGLVLADNAPKARKRRPRP